MANVNKPQGLQVFRAGGTYSYNAQGSLYSIPANDGTAYYLGDAVMAAASSDANGVSNVKYATSGTVTLRGAITGILPVYPGVSLAATALNLESAYIPATKAGIWYVLVDDDAHSVFSITDDGITTGSLVAASANLNFTLSLAAGATTNSLSGTTILSSSFATTNTFNMKAQGLVQAPGNVYGAYALWQARINEHELMGAQAGI